MKNQRHTPTPWHLSPTSKIILAPNGKMIADLSHSNFGSTDNSLYVLMACNAFPALVEAHRRVMATVDESLVHPAGLEVSSLITALHAVGWLSTLAIEPLFLLL